MSAVLAGVAQGAAGGLTNALFATQAQHASWGQAKHVMDREDWRYNTAHQREVQDLIAAGLNPTLSAGGSGAASGSGQMGSVPVPQVSMPNIVDAMVQSKQLELGQQKIDIDKGLAASAIAKNTTSNELTKAKTLTEKGGLLTKTVGSTTMDRYEEILKGIKEKAKEFWNSNNPENSPSSGGQLNMPQMGQPKY